MPAKNKQSQTAKRRKTQNGKREITSEVTSDSLARNLLQNKPNLTPKSTKRQLKGVELKKHLRSAQLYGNTPKKNQKTYSEKDLDIPQLNKAINPGAIVKKRGKKGKKFIADDDSLTLNRLVKQINDDRDLINESKLEKAKRLEEIRALRKEEMERKEQAKKNKLESVKVDIKQKASMARIVRRKNAKEAKKQIFKEADKEVKGKKPRKSVSFA
ncbi:unnamed protein product [Ambrosiozyma monospora]|uniref:60S ribosomal subunit assembly/export protein LOC1 n=1 Tax=Ambrosiozyma monospora TaxID=43982 RepID=A0A9W6YTZ9_AMBMO|nr:unnamed protein product [Ambrosiozyma monospora]